MSDRSIRPVRVDVRGTTPIEMIARAELARSVRAQEPVAADGQPDMVPPSGLNRPQGLAAILDEALGSVELPTLFELQSALSAAADRLAGNDPASEFAELDKVVVAVLREEQDKIGRYMTVRDK